MNIYLLCVIIFFVRIIDTSLATVRTILTIKNKIYISTFIAFFEILIWFLIVREAFNTQSNNILVAISYSLGFATGIFIGIFITNKLVTTVLTVNVVINQNKKEILNALKENNFAFSIIKIKGRDLISNKDMLFVVTTNKKVDRLKGIITAFDDKAFIMIGENRQVYNGYY